MKYREPILKKYKEPILDIKPSKKNRIKKQFLLILVVFILLLFITTKNFFSSSNSTYVLNEFEYSIVSRNDIKETLNISGSVQIRNEEIIRAPSTGLISEILVAEGDVLNINELCIKLLLESVHYDIDSSIAQIEKLKIENKMNKELFESDREVKKQELLLLGEDLKVKHGYYLEQKILYESGIISRKALEDTGYLVKVNELSYLTKENNIKTDIIRFNYNILINKNEIKLINKRIINLNEKQNSSLVYNKISGSITEILKKVNDYVYKNDELLIIHDQQSAVIILEVPESKISTIKIGADTQFYIGGNSYKGTINKIGNRAINKDSSYEAVIEVEVIPVEKGQSFMSGISADVEILLGLNKNAMNLPRSQYLTSGNQEYVYVIKGIEAIKTKIEYGYIDSSYVVITNGLKNGDKVITSSYDDFYELKKIDINEQGAILVQ